MVRMPHSILQCCGAIGKLLVLSIWSSFHDLYDVAKVTFYWKLHCEPLSPTPMVLILKMKVSGKHLS